VKVDWITKFIITFTHLSFLSLCLRMYICLMYPLECLYYCFRNPHLLSYIHHPFEIRAVVWLIV